MHSKTRDPVKLDFLKLRNWCFEKCFHGLLFYCLVNFFLTGKILFQMNEKEKGFDDALANIIRGITRIYCEME